MKVAPDKISWNCYYLEIILNFNFKSVCLQNYSHILQGMFHEVWIEIENWTVVKLLVNLSQISKEIETISVYWFLL